jgi:hypothetical protein
MSAKIPSLLVARVMARNEVEKAMRHLEKMLSPVERHSGMKVLADGILTDEFMAILPKIEDTATTKYTFRYWPSQRKGQSATLTWAAAIKVEFDGKVETEGATATFAFIHGGRLAPFKDGMFQCGRHRIEKFINARKLWATIQKSSKLEKEARKLQSEIHYTGISTWHLGDCSC